MSTPFHASNKHASACQLCCTKIEGLTVRVSGRAILDNINMHIHCSELTAIIGQNGAGKSTLIKSLLGTVQYEGTISFTKADGTHFSRPRIGYVPQHPSFAPDAPISVLDLFLSATQSPVWLPPTTKRRAGILYALERTGCAHLIDARMGTLSGGEMQRVLLALALMPLPELLLLDEPFSGVDIVGLESLYQLINSIRNDYDLSVIVVSHDMEFVKKYSDKSALLDCNLLEYGSTEMVLNSDSFRQMFLSNEGGQE